MTSPNLDINKSEDHDNDLDQSKLVGHAYHHNLPPQYTDENGISRVTKFADRKARSVVRLLHSIQLREDLYTDIDGDNEETTSDSNQETNAMDVDGDDDGDDDGDGEDSDNDSMVCFNA